MHFDLHSDGSGKDAIIVNAGGLASRFPVGPEALVVREHAPGISRHDAHLQLKGADIFSFAIREVPASIRRCLDVAGWALEHADYVVLHQANKMINDFIRKKVGYAPEAALSTLRQFGNTSSVSIPLTLAAHAAQLATGANLVLSGFGVGLSWASCTVSLAPGTVLNLLETGDVD
jgi:3-oxoacyl-[acyl-carrier-protein] synthase-3